MPGWGGINRQNTKDLQGSENTLCDAIMIYDYYTVVQTHRMNCKVNHKLWGLQCQYRFILGLKKGAILVNDVDNGRGYACVGTGVYGKFLPSFQLCCKPPIVQNIVLKNKNDSIKIQVINY